MAFDGLLKLIDRLIQFATIRRTRRKEVFNQVLKPLFAELEKVHTDYLTTFGDAARLMEEPDYFNKIIALVRERRLPLLPVREKLRQYIDQIKVSEFTDAECTFLTGVSLYVSVSMPWHSRLTQLALRMTLLKNKTVYGTNIPVDSDEDADRYLKLSSEEPSLESYAVFQYLQQIEDPAEKEVFEIVSSVIMGQIDALSSKWREVVDRYSRLQGIIAKL